MNIHYSTLYCFTHPGLGGVTLLSSPITYSLESNALLRVLSAVARCADSIEKSPSLTLENGKFRRQPSITAYADAREPLLFLA